MIIANFIKLLVELQNWLGLFFNPLNVLYNLNVDLAKGNFNNL